MRFDWQCMMYDGTFKTRDNSRTKRSERISNSLIFKTKDLVALSKMAGMPRYIVERPFSTTTSDSGIQNPQELYRFFSFVYLAPSLITRERRRVTVNENSQVVQRERRTCWRRTMRRVQAVAVVCCEIFSN